VDGRGGLIHAEALGLAIDKVGNHERERVSRARRQGSDDADRGMRFGNQRRIQKWGVQERLRCVSRYVNFAETVPEENE
jgi:hypothetical protein